MTAESTDRRRTLERNHRRLPPQLTEYCDTLAACYTAHQTTHHGSAKSISGARALLLALGAAGLLEVQGPDAQRVPLMREVLRNMRANTQQETRP